MGKLKESVDFRANARAKFVNDIDGILAKIRGDFARTSMLMDWPIIASGVCTGKFCESYLAIFTMGLQSGCTALLIVHSSVDSDHEVLCNGRVKIGKELEKIKEVLIKEFGLKKKGAPVRAIQTN